MIFKIRADRDVTSKGPEGSGVRRRTVALPGGGSRMFVIGREPVYLVADDIPPELESDAHLVITAVPKDEEPPDGAEVLDLKAERVQEPANIQAPAADLGAKGARPATSKALRGRRR